MELERKGWVLLFLIDKLEITRQAFQMQNILWINIQFSTDHPCIVCAHAEDRKLFYIGKNNGQHLFFAQVF